MSLSDVATEFETEIRARLGPLDKAPSGFESRDCMLCHLRGHGHDHKTRFGIIFAEDTISINCFNCGYKAKWYWGTTFSKNFMMFLSEIGFDKNEISRWQFKFFAAVGHIGGTSTDMLNTTSQSFPHDVISSWIESDAGIITLSDLIRKPTLNNNETRVLHYAIERKLMPYFNVLGIAENHPSRLAIPFYGKSNSVIGYTARAVVKSKAKYLDIYPDKSKCKDYLFGYTNSLISNHNYVIITDGVIDALHTNGVATMSNTISSTQENMLKYLGERKQIIVVPDYDKAGCGMIDLAERNNWWISIPNWDKNLKDVDDMVMKYGRLLTMHSIMMQKNKRYMDIKAKTKLIHLKGERHE